jgi:hypothetical protein
MGSKQCLPKAKGIKMRALVKLSAFAVLASMSHTILAQSVYGYNVAWGILSVPISPWMIAVISLMLLFATYAFLRRHAGQGLFMLATATLVGTLMLYTDKSTYAPPLPLYPITTTSGSNFFSCSSVTNSGYINTTANTITLTVTPVGGTPSTSAPNCSTGTQLSPGGSCSLPCVD